MSYRIRILSLKTNSSFMRRRDGDGVALFTVSDVRPPSFDS